MEFGLKTIVYSLFGSIWVGGGRTHDFNVKLNTGGDRNTVGMDIQVVGPDTMEKGMHRMSNF